MRFPTNTIVHWYSYGVVIAGVVGSTKLEDDIWSIKVNMAGTMEQSSQPSRANISEVTRKRVSDKFDLIYRGKIEAKNKGKMNMYFAEALLILLKKVVVEIRN
jgi:class 3 adenylate cyclase